MAVANASGGMADWQADERMTVALAEMGREGLVAVLRGLDCDFPIDFTDEYLASLALDRLRHIVLAAALRSRRAVCQA